MRIKNLCLAVVFFLTLYVCTSTRAQAAGRIESMKLLTTDTGWAATRNKLFWTTDGGASWKDITPKLTHKRQTLSSVFFLDPSTGWVLLNCGDDKDPVADDVCFEFALSADAGESWSIVRPPLVDPAPRSTIMEDGQGFSGTTYLDFVDALHGWAIIKRNLSSTSSSGVMLRTTDGGKTWTQLPNGSLPIADHFHFVTANDGWIAGGGQPESDLYVTRDAGGSWNQVVVNPPATVKVQEWPPARNGVWPDCRLPYFDDARHGYLIAAYWDGSESTPVLFATSDLGISWSFVRSLAGIDGSIGFLDTTMFAVSTPKAMNRLTLSRFSLIRTDVSPASVSAEVPANSIRHYNLGAGRDVLTMTSDTRGWLLADELLATSDGGTTWSEISPPEARMPTVPHVSRETARSKKISNLSRTTYGATGSSSGPNAGSVSTHLGFDKSRVVCPTSSQCNSSQSLTAMKSLLTSSPFYDASLYLPGSPNRTTDPAVSPSWVQGAVQQGWGLVPIWFGLQSSCIINQPNVTQYFGVNGNDPSTQGAEEADLAVAAAQTLGISSGIIYTDIENYTVNSTCSPLVQAYVDAWVTEIHVYSGYLAGVYANPGPINSDISNQNVAQADAIWITKTPAAGKPPQVTIWNQGIKDTLWPNNQRLHQFLINQQGVTWGGITFNPSVDEDVDNSSVWNANAIAKPYTYSATDIDCPGAISTIPTAMNDMNVNAFINGPGQIGTIVGTYQTSLTSPNYAYQSSGGDCASFTVFGSTNVQPWGINNSGMIAGYFEDSNGAYHGFTLSSSGTATQVDYNSNGQTATATYLYGINDAGQAVGWAYSPTTFGYQTFMYYGGDFYPLGVSGGGSFDYTQGYGINGQATLTGLYYFQPYLEDFELSATPGTSGNTITWGGEAIGITPGGSADTIAKGIDANDELAGFYESTACVNTTNQCGFEWGGGPTLTILLYGDDANVAEGINNFAEIVGPYTDSITELSHALVWTHQ